jgi:uncharacterized membrane protein YhaH (DUF805 family)
MVSQGGSEINTQLPPIPGRLLIAIVLVTVEGMLLWGLTILAGLALFSGDSSSLISTLFLIGIIFAAAIWLSNIALGLRRLKRWSHTAALVVQLIFAAIGSASLVGEFAQPLIGVPLLLLALTVFVALFNSRVRELYLRDY